MLLPAEHAQFFKYRFEALIAETFDDNALTNLTGEGGQLVSLNDYSGNMSAKRHPRTESRDLLSVLIEWNRGLIGHSQDPMFEALAKQDIRIEPKDRTKALHEITNKVIGEYQSRYLT